MRRPRRVAGSRAAGPRPRLLDCACCRDVEIRPMRDEDVVDADRVCAERALHVLFDDEQERRARRAPARAHPPSAAHRSRRRVGGRARRPRRGRRARARPRAGSGASRSSRVAEDLQGQRRRPRAARRARWAYGESAAPTGWIILSSTNPQAMRTLRARRAADLRPCVGGGGRSPTSRARRTARRRRGRRRRRASRLADAHRPRAARRRPRARPARADGPRRAAAGLRGPRLRRRAREQPDQLLGARDERGRRSTRCGPRSPPPRRGRRRSSTSSPPRQQWALRVCLDARLPLSPDGPMFAGADGSGPLAPLHPERRLPLGGAAGARAGRAGQLVDLLVVDLLDALDRALDGGRVLASAPPS